MRPADLHICDDRAGTACDHQVEHQICAATYLEKERLHLVLKQVKADLVRQEDVILHASADHKQLKQKKMHIMACTQKLSFSAACCQLHNVEGLTHRAAVQKPVENLGHLRCIVQEHEALADVHPVWLRRCLTQPDQQLEHLQSIVFIALLGIAVSM